MIVTEDEKWVQFDQDGNSQLINSKPVKRPGISYRKVHHIDEVKDPYSSEAFTDVNFVLSENDCENIDNTVERVKFKRLRLLYKSNSDLPELFPQERPPTQNYNKQQNVPAFLTELDLYHYIHYKSLFLTDKVTDNGLYQIIYNQDGRF